jgi:hypothetical protein
MLPNHTSPPLHTVTPHSNTTHFNCRLLLYACHCTVLVIYFCQVNTRLRLLEARGDEADARLLSQARRAEGASHADLRALDGKVRELESSFAWRVQSVADNAADRAAGHAADAAELQSKVDALEECVKQHSDIFQEEEERKAAALAASNSLIFTPAPAPSPPKVGQFRRTFRIGGSFSERQGSAGADIGEGDEDAGV